MMATEAENKVAEADLGEWSSNLNALAESLKSVKQLKPKIKDGSATEVEKSDFKAAAAKANDSAKKAKALPSSRMEALKVFAEQKEVKRVTELIKKSQEVDLCFVLDATSSMGSIIQAVKKQIRAIVDEIARCVPHLKIRLGLVAYRDLCDGDKRFEVTDFQSSIPLFESALRVCEAIGGGDQCEDVIGGLEKATTLSWAHTTKVLLLCGDAPCHGSDYHNGCGDHHPDGTGTLSAPILSKLEQMGIDCTFMRLNSTTDRMIDKFNKECGAALPEDFIGIADLDTDNLLASMTDSVTKSLRDSISKSSKDAAAKKRTFTPLAMGVIKEKKSEEAAAVSASSNASSSSSGDACPSKSSTETPSSWTAAQLSKWLKEKATSNIADQAAEQEIDGAMAVAMVRVDWMELGSSSLQAASITSKLKKLESEHSAAAVAA